MNSGPRMNVCVCVCSPTTVLELRICRNQRGEKNTWMEPCQLLLFIGASLIWLLLYCLCPVPVVLTHSSHGVPLQETSCSEWCRVWWAGRTVGHAPPYTVHSETSASHHSPHSTVYICHNSCLAGHLVKKKKYGTVVKQECVPVKKQWKWEMVVDKYGK